MAFYLPPNITYVQCNIFSSHFLMFTHLALTAAAVVALLLHIYLRSLWRCGEKYVQKNESKYFCRDDDGRKERIIRRKTEWKRALVGPDCCLQRKKKNEAVFDDGLSICVR